MKLAIYSTKQYDRKYLELVNQQFGYELEFFDFLLSKKNRQNGRRLQGGVYLRQRRRQP